MSELEMKKHFAHGEIENDGSLTIRGIYDGTDEIEYVTSKNVKTFDVWLVSDGSTTRTIIDIKSEKK